MTPHHDNMHLSEIGTLTRSAENVLRKLISFLVGRISLVKLQEMVRFIYIEEAEDQLKTENPSKNVSLTQLALMTGLDTRTLSRTRNHETYRRPFYKKTSFLREFTPAAAILDAWGSHSAFLDPNTKSPKKLALTGGKDSFESLFSTTIKSRGVTQQSLLHRLIESGAVRLIDNDQSVELVEQTYLATHSEDQLGAFEMGYAAAANLMETIIHNFETNSNEEKFFQRGVWTHRLSRRKRLVLKQALNNVLQTAEREARELLRDSEEEFESPNHITAGVSLFYFEDTGD